MNSVVRMNPLVQPIKKNDNDDWNYPEGLRHDDFQLLVELELDAIEDNEVKAIKQLTKAWLRNDVTNQSIRADGSSLEHEIGHKHYRDALVEWLKFEPSAFPSDSIERFNNRDCIIKKLA